MSQQSSMPSSSQPWRPKSQKTAGASNQQQQQTPTGQTPVGAPRHSFETDGQISHRTHKFPHQQHAFQKYQENQQQQQPAMPLPAGASSSNNNSAVPPPVAPGAVAGSTQVPATFNVEDALDAFSNIQELKIVQQATEWAPVSDSGVKLERAHKNPQSFVKMCNEAFKE